MVDARRVAESSQWLLGRFEAEVRADERERIAQALAWKWSDAMGRYREERTTYWEGQTDALDQAEQIAKAGGAR